MSYIMPCNDAPIQPLPADVAAKIRSSISITNLNGVVVELVKNAFDADAVSINITLDSRRGGCIVEDNGHGILPAEFEEGSGLCQPHNTSKLGLGKEVYGYRGMFLASLAAMSLLTITSRHSQQAGATTVIFHHSKLISRLVPTPLQQVLDHYECGTRVTVNDLFGNMPVRVKSRALALQRSDGMDREWDELKRLLAALLLANERLVKLTLLELDRNRRIIIRAKSSNIEGVGLGQTAVDLPRIGSILTQFGLISLKDIDSWVSVSASTLGISIHSSISLSPSPTKQTQFISIGVHPILPQSTANVLYNEINRIFAASDFGTTKSNEERRKINKNSEHFGPNIKNQTKGINRWPMFYIRIEMTESWKRTNGEAEVVESERSLQRIMDVITTMLHQFLEQQRLRPRARKRLRRSPSLEPDKRDMQASRKQGVTNLPTTAQPPIRHKLVGSTKETFDNCIKLPSFRKELPTFRGQDFDSWSRIKSGSGNALDELRSGLRKKPEFTQRKTLPYRSSQAFSGSISGTDSHYLIGDNIREGSGTDVNGLHENRLMTQMTRAESGDRVISWMSLLAKDNVLINSRTGHCLLRAPSSSPVMGTLLPCARPRSTGFLEARRNVATIKRPQSAPASKHSGWLENVMDKWDNPVFSRSEKPISSIRSSIDGEGSTQGIASSQLHSCSFRPLIYEDSSTAKFEGRLSKRGLAEADIIAQVDRKFVLVKMNSAKNHNSRSMLVLIDQHAADERCRIEQLFTEMFLVEISSTFEFIKVRTSELADSIDFEVATQEAKLFEAYSKFFASWGCHYEVSEMPDIARAVVAVRRLPTLVVERCRTEPKLAIDLLRGEIWKREESNSSLAVRSALGDPQNLPRAADGGPLLIRTFESSFWVKPMADCPQGIIDLLNSRACRSAVMFNDTLSLEDCRSLVSRLSQCTFPFQCAHGRPSMIPILDMPSPTRENDLGTLDPDYEQSGIGGHSGFARAYRTWKENQIGA